MTSKRDLDAANETAFLASHVKPVFFARLDFSTGVERFHTEIGPITATHPVFGSEAYSGLGDFGGISGEVVESISGSPKSLKLVLTGVKASLITTVLTANYFRRDAEVMVGLENSAGALVADPEIIFSGFMDKPDFALSDGLGQVTMHCESRGANLLRASDVRFSDEDKQAEVSGDLWGEYIYRMADITIRWGDRTWRSPYAPNIGPGNRPRPGGPRK